MSAVPNWGNLDCDDASQSATFRCSLGIMTSWPLLRFTLVRQCHPMSCVLFPLVAVAHVFGFQRNHIFPGCCSRVNRASTSIANLYSPWVSLFRKNPWNSEVYEEWKSGPFDLERLMPRKRSFVHFDRETNWNEILCWNYQIWRNNKVLALRFWGHFIKGKGMNGSKKCTGEANGLIFRLHCHWKLSNRSSGEEFHFTLRGFEEFRRIRGLISWWRRSIGSSGAKLIASAPFQIGATAHSEVLAKQRFTRSSNDLHGQATISTAKPHANKVRCDKLVIISLGNEQWEDILIKIMTF